MLPAVVRFNSAVVEQTYLRLAPGGSEALAERLEELRAVGGLAESLQDRGVPRDTLETLARLATEEWTGGFNPRPLGKQDFLELYKQAYA